MLAFKINPSRIEVNKMKRERQNREKNAKFQTPSRRTINGFIASVLFACVMDLFFSVYECQKTTDKCVVGMQLFVVFFSS